jgi:hypothetical protein
MCVLSTNSMSFLVVKKMRKKRLSNEVTFQFSQDAATRANENEVRIGALSCSLPFWLFTTLREPPFFFLLKTFRRISIHQVLIMQLTNSWIPEWISSNFVAWCWNRWRTMKRLIMLRQSTRTCPVLWIFFSVISMLESRDYSKVLEHDFSLNLSGPRFRQYASVKKGLTRDFRYPYVSWRSLQQLACQPSSLLALHAWVSSEVSFHSPKYNKIIKATHERCCTVRLA